MTPLTKRLAIGLAISVAVNLLLAGILVGFGVQRWAHGHGAVRPAASIAASARRGERSDAHFGPMHGAFREHRSEFKERRQKASAARSAVQAALEQEPFDRAALERALEALRKETSEGQGVAHRTLLETAASASLPERKQMAAEFAARRRGPRHPRP
ncbi:MAG TPA: periplasmic heavy metal sensor [Polyangiaceae bacterium]